MPSSETPQHREIRHALRQIRNDIESLDAHQLDSSLLKKYKICMSPMELDESSNDRPIFFRPCDASLLLNPDDQYDEGRSEYTDYDSWDPELRLHIDCARSVLDYISYYVFASSLGSKDFILRKTWSGVSTSDEPFRGLWRDTYPEYGTMRADQVKDHSSPHMKAMLYSNLDGNNNSINDELLQGEILVALRLAHTQMRRRRLHGHMTVPVLLFCFMGPQHARVIEAYFNGTSFVMRTTRLFDLRKKDEALIKCFGQWYLGEPTGDTRYLHKV
ncbi:hypothetical protein BO79DRAFT_259989 [Aspergillus costaricaensis CBS 115574]|uniref:Uncharacterized protein n=1 Tax=Aspergillus costaricaensis CBS 115574 TaxID=1448317 RepID=A0ACD1I0B8_9EURO|nr:hypothetical protein BO79DRAFT_259989 [Aspergillus costaricaensis CBS 115574]RAK83668.1 hypothetical protein BO79DRAFT_259989 [Aspergillus costaricaensis CBS 115574]